MEHSRTSTKYDTSTKHCVKSVRIRSFSGVIQSECGKIRTRKTQNTDQKDSEYGHPLRRKSDTNNVTCSIGSVTTSDYHLQKICFIENLMKIHLQYHFFWVVLNEPVTFLAKMQYII